MLPIFDRKMINEYRMVLNRRKFGFSPDTVEYLISSIEQFGVSVEPSSSGITLPYMKDLPFYEVSLEISNNGSDAYLVTGNLRHFPVKPFVVTPRVLLDILNSVRD